ncbi:MAG: type IV toxin-antitoxin system AbiEi family antitoxin domain-containing protein [Parcubacteria group bacterium]
MSKLLQKINKIPKSWFTFADIRKITGLDDGSLAVTLSRMVKRGELVKVAKGIYATDISKIDWEQFAVEKYPPNYTSFESALARHNILSQQPASLTMATTNRSKKTKMLENMIIYRHIQPKLFWGYSKEGNILIADPEKAFLDLAYLSLNGYAKFDPEEINLDLLNKQKIKTYLKKFNSPRLNKLIKNILVE